MLHVIAMKVAVYNQKGEKTKDITMSDSFEKVASKEAVTLYVNYLRNALRGAVANTKDRSEVSGGGKKPWKQKGTGRARAGSSRSPLWPGGGVTFGPTNDRTFRAKVNKSLKTSVIASMIGVQLKNKNSRVIESLTVEEPKTSHAAQILGDNQVEGKISLIVSEEDTNAALSFRNISGVKLMSPSSINLIDIMSSDGLVISETAAKKIDELYGKTKKKLVETK